MAALVKKLHIVPVRRVPNDDHKYRPSSYEVGVQELGPTADNGGSSSLRFLSHKLNDGQPLASNLLLYQEHPIHEDNSSTIKHLLRDRYGVEGLSVHPLACTSSSDDHQHTVNLLFIVPINNNSDGSGSDIEFVNLEDLIEQPGQLMNRSDRDRLLVIDQWLSERHLIPTVNIDQLFSSELSGIGVVQNVVSNPLKDVNVPPKEQQLVISFNNPAFPVAKT